MMAKVHWWLHALFLTVLAGGIVYVVYFLPPRYNTVVKKEKEIVNVPVEVPVVKYLDKVKTEFVTREVKVYQPSDEEMERIIRELRLRESISQGIEWGRQDRGVAFEPIPQKTLEDIFREQELLTIAKVPKLHYGGQAAATLDREGTTHIIISPNQRHFFELMNQNAFGAYYGWGSSLGNELSIEYRYDLMRFGNTHVEFRTRLNDVGGMNYWGAEAGVVYKWEW